MLNNLLYGNFPFMIMAPEEGGDGAGAGGGDAGGDQGAGQGDQGKGGDSGDKGNQGGAGEGAGDEGGKSGDQGAGQGDQAKGKKAGDATQKPAAKVGDKEKQPGGMWSENWRQEYAKDDEKTLAFLNRFTSPKALIDKLMEQDKMIRGGGHKKAAPGKDATDEEKAAYRKDAGLPEKPEGYLDFMPEGLVLGEDIKEQAAGYLESMHALNAPPELVAAGLEAFQKHQEAYAAMVTARDKEMAAEAEKQLRQDYGQDYDANIQALHNFIEGNFAKDVQESLMNARLGDDEGTPLFCSPAIIDAFSRIQREFNPMGSTASGKGMDNLDSIDDQIKVYEERMGKDRKGWFKDEKAQAHYRDLLSARERYKSRAAKA